MSCSRFDGCSCNVRSAKTKPNGSMNHRASGSSLPASCLQLFHRRLVSLHRFQVVRRVAGKPLDDRFRFRSVVDSDEQIVFDKVNRLLRLRRRLAAGMSNTCSVVSPAFAVDFVPFRAANRFSIAASIASACFSWPVTSIVTASDASCPLRSISDRLISPTETPFRSSYVSPSFRSIAPKSSRICFLKVVDERLHHVVVEHLPKLGLVPPVVELFRMGDRDVALRRLRQQSVAGRACRRRQRPAEVGERSKTPAHGERS